MRKFNLTSRVVRRLAGLDNRDGKEKNAETTRGAVGRSHPEQSCSDQSHPGQNQPVSAAAEAGGIRLAWRTHVGKVRRNNQDAVILGNGLAGIADGMGGHLGGEIASGGLRDGLIRETAGAEPAEDTLRKAVEKVNWELWDRQTKDESLTGMGTTLTVLWPAKQGMVIAQVGDSRAYLLRDGTMQQVTKDHSMVADMVRRGILTEEQAACHPMRNYITRAVGTDETVEPDMLCMPRQAGDRWLICSDGLHGLVSKTELARMMAKENLEESANEMLDAALGNGGRDNISLVLLEDTEGGKPGAEMPPAEGAEQNDRTAGEVSQ